VGYEQGVEGSEIGMAGGYDEKTLQTGNVK
jgi:hypothetical protein